MSKKLIFKILLSFVVLLIGNFLNAELLDLYKKGRIKLEADPNFGRNTDWELLFYDLNKDFIMAPDGSLFVANSSQHNIFKFNPTGDFILKFGSVGRGPGDFYYPGDLSILDNKYLVINEYASLRRINLFDLSGHYIKVIKTDHDVFFSIALGNNKVAYLTSAIEGKEPEQMVRKEIIIKDLETGLEKTIFSAELPFKSKIKIRGAGIYFDNYIGDVIIAKTFAGNLLVGVSNTPDIKIYSQEGKLIRSFRLGIPPEPVTPGYIRNVKDEMVTHEKESHSPPEFLKAVEAFDFRKVFAEYLPYYRDILVDSEGNILVFKWLNCVGKSNEIFQVYTSEGKFVCETTIDKGIFDFEINLRRKNIIFTDKGIFGLFQLADSDDIFLRLVKVLHKEK